MISRKSILFLTTTNAASNPRLVKELKMALDWGFQATLVFFTLGNWSDAKNKTILSELRVVDSFDSIVISATKSSFIVWLWWGLAEKMAKGIFSFFKKNLFVNSLASTRRSFQICHAVKNIRIKPDLICAHNLGTLYPAWRLSKRLNVPFIFDMEDYHPGEYIRNDAVNEKQRREYLIKRLLPEATAITSASPLIEKYTLELIGGHHNHQVILNSFSKSEFLEPLENEMENMYSSLRFVWFSQKISFGRGLEQFFKAVVLLGEELSLKEKGLPMSITLIGELDESFNTTVLSSVRKTPIGKCITILTSMSQIDLHQSLSSFDIGLALEPGKDLNNLLAVSNKIMAYAQSGLYILATNTPAQSEFINNHPSVGYICGQSEMEMKEALINLYQRKGEIISMRHHRFLKAEELSWEREAIKLKDFWDAVLQRPN